MSWPIERQILHSDSGHIHIHVKLGQKFHKAILPLPALDTDNFCSIALKIPITIY